MPLYTDTFCGACRRIGSVPGTHRDPVECPSCGYHAALPFVAPESARPALPFFHRRLSCVNCGKKEFTADDMNRRRICAGCGLIHPAQ